MEGFDRFILRSILIGASAVAILVGVYVWVDPFKVVRYHPIPVAPDRGVEMPYNQATVAIRGYERARTATRPDALLLGSSLADHIPADVWRRYLPEGSRPYHLFASGETVEQIRRKVEWVESLGDTIGYALLFVSPNELLASESTDPAFIGYPAVDSDVSWIDYHMTFITAFYDRDFLRSYLFSSLADRAIEVGGVRAPAPYRAAYDPTTNERTEFERESLIICDPAEYYKDRYWQAPPQGTLYRLRRPSIDAKMGADLRAIADAFDRMGVDYQVVTPPNATGVALNRADIEWLRHTFGARYHYLAETMLWATHVDTLWHDHVHWRPSLAAALCDSIYRSDH